MADRDLGLRGVVTYTTRPIREGETDALEYNFITDAELEAFKKDGRLIELRQYKTVRGIWSYCTVDDGQIRLDLGNYLVIATLDGFESLAAFFGKDSVKPLYINVEDGLRLERSLLRERIGQRPDYKEMCRRFLADSHDYSAERLIDSGIGTCYDNVELEQCVERIRADILRQMHTYPSGE
jgi:guanylate kinase